MMRAIFSVVLAGVAIVAAVFYFGALGLAGKAAFAPASVAIDNRVFHESQQYNDGMSRNLDDLRMAYLDAHETPEGKASIRAIILHRFAGYDVSRLSDDQRAFLRQLRGF